MIELDAVTAGYDDPVVSDVSFDVERGELVALLGPNGVGKSTLLRTVLGLRDPLSGTVTLDGEDVATLERTDVARRLGYVPQSESGGLPSTVFETVLTGRKPHTSWRPTAEDREVVGEVLTEVGIDDLAMRPLTDLSGGQRQQVRLARALAQQPAALVLDEPTSSLDLRHQFDVLDHVARLADEGLAVLFALHDLELATRYADRLVFLADGEVAAVGGPEVVTSDLVAEVYDIRARVVDVEGHRVVLPDP
ncbi:ABC transporter ATP-binding protein [Salinirubellus salinus]|uniref:Cobalamin import ATP-binding protein BtuD n=1 Tax=Salinirubellus salinus TaxID=1364945 RepID=A0A9E7R198_9EURY|nr:ABC transporter ATP-binding protein [Salinirubellus salinus]UWM53048.1 ABC transporter ATP-binding protein [Salinirubellus salinus]